MAVKVKSTMRQSSAESNKSRSVIDESEPLAVIKEIAKDMHAAGGLSNRAMRKYDELGAPESMKTGIIAGQARVE